MRPRPRIKRLPSRAPTARRVARPGALRRTLARAAAPALKRGAAQASRTDAAWSGFRPDPYVDYGRALTPEGGIVIGYKDYDRRLRHSLWALFAWTAATLPEGWFLLHHSPLHSAVPTAACFLAAAAAAANAFIVLKPVEIYRRIEIRPDCMILDGADIFWLQYMEGGWPTFQPDSEGNQVLCGIYGTRFVAYLSIPRFDELDRAPEVFASHLQDAMQQLWSKPY